MIRTHIDSDPRALGHAIEQGSMRFDQVIALAWEARARCDDASSIFRSRWQDVRRRQLRQRDGRVGRFVAQCNPGRVLRRSPARSFLSTNEPFDPNAFHFDPALLRPDELLVDIKIGSVAVSIYLNVCPFGRNHFLAVLDPHRHHPQRLDRQALQLARYLVELSQCADLKLGFNSLSACASVNHLHLQGIYFCSDAVHDDLMPVERAHRRNMTSNICTLRDYPVAGFVISGNSSNQIDATLRVLHQLQTEDIAHNVLVSRESIVVLPRVSEHTVAGTPAAALAFLELAGEVLVTGPDAEAAACFYDHMLDEDAADLLAATSLGEDRVQALANCIAASS